MSLVSKKMDITYFIRIEQNLAQCLRNVLNMLTVVGLGKEERMNEKDRTRKRLDIDSAKPEHLYHNVCTLQ